MKTLTRTPRGTLTLPQIDIGGRTIIAYDPARAFEVCEAVANGKTLSEVLDNPGMPARSTWYRWVMLYPELAKAYDAARKISAEAMEDTLLLMVGELKDGTREMSRLLIQRYQIAMAQLRWSAERRDPARFGERKEQAIVVPIQINTTLDLGQGSVSSDLIGNVYEVRATVEAQDGHQRPDPDPSGAYMDDASEEAALQDPEDLGDPFGLPPVPKRKTPALFRQKVIKPPPPEGVPARIRPRNGKPFREKSPARIKQQQTIAARKAKEKEQDNGETS